MLIWKCFLCKKDDLDLWKSPRNGQLLGSTWPRLRGGFLALLTAEPCVPTAL